MKRLLVVLLLTLSSAPLTCQAEIPGFLKAKMGTLSGQVMNENGKPLPGGIVSFFDTGKGIPPLIADTHRIPDMVARMKPDGTFRVKLLPGSYYMGALIITNPRRGPGPPRKGETFYFIKDDKGQLRELAIKTKESKNIGTITGALPETFTTTKQLISIRGRLLMEDGKPLAGGIVLAKTDMNKARPDFISARTDKEGHFILNLPPDTQYYLIGRESNVGRPAAGSYIGTYGSTSSISEGGALPVGTAPARPASGMPQMFGIAQGPGEAQPTAVTGKAGETLIGYDIMMFKVPVPGEQRQKLQGTLGFGGDRIKKKVQEAPTLPSPASN